jgi:DNA-binding transcriptional MerR regulator
MTTTPPPDDPVWAHVRLRYEQDQEAVQQIAESVGLHRITLSSLAKKLGWRLRGKPKAPPARKVKSKAETTQATIKRLKDILQQRVAQLEDQLKAIGTDVAALSTERDMRATSTLVRTIEKVLDLERKERSRRHKQTVGFKYFDDAQRAQLAEKIARLQREWRGTENLDDTGEHGSAGAEQPVALLGEARQTTAAGGD